MATKAPSKTGKLTPLNDHVIVERVEAQSTTKGGIVLPDTAKEKPKEGLVIAVGEGRLTEDGQRIPVQVKPSTSRTMPAAVRANENKRGLAIRSSTDPRVGTLDW